MFFTPGVLLARCLAAARQVARSRRKLEARYQEARLKPGRSVAGGQVARGSWGPGSQVARARVPLRPVLF